VIFSEVHCNIVCYCIVSISNVPSNFLVSQSIVSRQFPTIGNNTRLSGFFNLFCFVFIIYGLYTSMDAVLSLKTFVNKPNNTMEDRRYSIHSTHQMLYYLQAFFKGFSSVTIVFHQNPSLRVTAVFHQNPKNLSFKK